MSGIAARSPTPARRPSASSSRACFKVRLDSTQARRRKSGRTAQFGCLTGRGRLGIPPASGCGSLGTFALEFFGSGAFFSGRGVASSAPASAFVQEQERFVHEGSHHLRQNPSDDWWFPSARCSSSAASAFMYSARERRASRRSTTARWHASRRSGRRDRHSMDARRHVGALPEQQRRRNGRAREADRRQGCRDCEALRELRRARRQCRRPDFPGRRTRRT